MLVFLIDFNNRTVLPPLLIPKIDTDIHLWQLMFWLSCTRRDPEPRNEFERVVKYVWDHVVSKAKKRHAELQGRLERAGPGWPEQKKMEIEVNTVNPRP